ncbi:glyoxalase superfamily protein [Pseudomonas poae]|uniref:Glyoxalase-related protein domain-containing protein n=1 Tax=Pseudomonas poae TaxID=200451 RepID=A0ABY0RXC5_9PSED|nr:glyoxalase superfamily protein [Pseudomonas poae]SDO59152.1 hypothetical protein SAMN04490208_4285 [Pseudomonas poae]
MRDYLDAKALALTLRQELASKEINFGHGECLEIVSRMLGKPNWNTLSADIHRRSLDRNPPYKIAHASLDGETSISVVMTIEKLNKFCGSYACPTLTVMKVYRKGLQLFYRLSYLQEYELHALDENAFSIDSTDNKVVFDLDSTGQVRSAIFSGYKEDDRLFRISDDEANLKEKILQERINENKPSVGSQAALLYHINNFMLEEPNFGHMSSGLEAACRLHHRSIQSLLKEIGPIKGVKFVGIQYDGSDIYHVEHEKRLIRWTLFWDAERSKIISCLMSPGG